VAHVVVEVVLQILIYLLRNFSLADSLNLSPCLLRNRGLADDGRVQVRLNHEVIRHLLLVNGGPLLAEGVLNLVG